MLTLGIDTAGAGAIVSLDDGSALTTMEATIRPQGEALSDTVGRALMERGAKFSDLSALAVSLGPGSFTGLRIGLAYAKGVCVARSVPLLGLTRFEETVSVYGAGFDALVATVSHRQVYLWVRDSLALPSAGSAHAGGRVSVADSAGTMDRIATLPSSSRIGRISAFGITPPDYSNSAVNIAELALSSESLLRSARGRSLSFSPNILESIEPFYAQPSTAEILHARRMGA